MFYDVCCAFLLLWCMCVFLCVTTCLGVFVLCALACLCVRNWYVKMKLVSSEFISGLEKITTFRIPSDKVNVYLRVSTNSQEFDNQSIDVFDYLIPRCINYDIFCEKKSAYMDEGCRQLELDHLIEITEVCLVVSQCDRFGRNVKKVKERLDKLHKKGLCVFSIFDMVSSRDPSFMELIKCAQYSSYSHGKTMKNTHRRNKEARAKNEDPYDKNYKPSNNLPPVPSVRCRPSRTCDSKTKQTMKGWCDSDNRDD